MLTFEAVFGDQTKIVKGTNLDEIKASAASRFKLDANQLDLWIKTDAKEYHVEEDVELEDTIDFIKDKNRTLLVKVKVATVAAEE